MRHLFVVNFDTCFLVRTMSNICIMIIPAGLRRQPLDCPTNSLGAITRPDNRANARASQMGTLNMTIPRVSGAVGQGLYRCKENVTCNRIRGDHKVSG